MKGLWLRLRALFARDAVERELDDEFRFHVDMETEANLRLGLDPDEARRRALVAFGGVERFKEEARGARGTRWVEDGARDAFFAARSLARSPGFTLAALVTLAMGVGATTAVFSVVRGVVFRPLPFPDAGELVTVWLHNPPQGIDKDVTSWPNFRDWREQSAAFQHMVAVRTPRWALTGEGDPEEIRVGMVSDGFFDMLGAPLALGRGFLPEESEVDAGLVAVLSHGLWTRRFGADPGILGRPVRLNEEAYTVVGVTAPGRGYPRDADVWVPFAFRGGLEGMREARASLWLPVVGRLADGVTLDEARAEMSAIAFRLAEAHPDENEGTSVLLEPLLETLVGDVRTPLLMLLGAVAFILLIVVANVANLLLARGAGRGREMAVRLSLGAGRGRIVRQMMVESVVLAAAGGVLGVGAAYAGVAGILALSPPDVPRLNEVAVDPSVLLFALALALGSGLVFGVLPAVQAGRADPARRLREEERGTGSAGLSRLRAAFVSGQFAVALVLLVGAGLLLRSFANLRAVDPGFDPDGVLGFSVSLPGARYGDAEAIRSFQERLLAELGELPGVEEAALVSTLFLDRLPNMAGITVESRPAPTAASRERPVVYDAASPSFFTLLRIGFVAGSSFGPVRPEDPSVAVVNQTFVRAFLEGQDAVGERFAFGTPQTDDDWITIVGVVEDTRRSGPDAAVRPEAYFSFRQLANRRFDVLLRARGEPLALAPAARGTVAGLDPSLPVTGLRTLPQALAGGLAQRRFVLFLLGVFAAVATLLAAVGVYGVTAYMVGRRRREIGIRVALGAGRSRVQAAVLREGMGQAGMGLAVGVAGALLLTRFVRSQLFGLEPTDPVTFLAVAALLGGVAALGSWVPARRAARVDPMESLRDD